MQPAQWQQCNGEYTSREPSPKPHLMRSQLSLPHSFSLCSPPFRPLPAALRACDKPVAAAAVVDEPPWECGSTGAGSNEARGTAVRIRLHDMWRIRVSRASLLLRPAGQPKASRKGACAKRLLASLGPLLGPLWPLPGGGREPCATRGWDGGRTDLGADSRHSATHHPQAVCAASTAQKKNRKEMRTTARI